MLTSSVISQDFPKLQGEYLGQNPPGMIPEIYAPGIISHGFHEQSITFSIDGSEAFYTISDNNYSQYIIVHLTSINNVWQEPKIAEFSGNSSDLSPFFSPYDGKLYFTSRRDYIEDSLVVNDLNIWYSEGINGKWSQAIKMESKINTNNKEGLMSIASNGNAYFQARYNDNWDIYISTFKDGHYQIPEKINSNINTEYNECAPYISPDESFLLFHSNRKGGYGINDIYISFKSKEGYWQDPINLGEKINTNASEFNPTITPDGKYLFFSSYVSNPPDSYKNKNYTEIIELYFNPKNGYATLYWVDSKIINLLR
jgi:Tol biopolymer transport system component